ncbi:MAG: patatin-like phospholipase family protein [bacterium]
MKNSKKQTALVLGSGGARGLAHIGVIKALEENNIPINIITGTSIGAFVGGVYASGKSISEMEKIISDVDKLMVAKIMIPKLFGPGIIDNKRVIEFIKELVGDIKIENLKVPFACVATDFVTGEEVIFNKDMLADAIMASMAIPTIFQPVLSNKRYLLDGGLSNPLPIRVAKEMGARKIIAVNVSPNPKRITKKIKTKKTKEVKEIIKKLPSKFYSMLPESISLFAKNDGKQKIIEKIEGQTNSPSMMNVLLQSISISTNNLIEQHLRQAKPDILISPKIEDFDMLEFYKGIDIIKCGYDEAIRLMPAIKNAITR